MKELVIIQSQLKAPKNQHNSFGKYNYRSCEDITEAVKPLLLETKTTLVVSDEIVTFGEGKICKKVEDFGYEDENKNWIPDIRENEVVEGLSVFVKATATLTNEAGETVSATAFARHPESKKGMDDSQITGSTSSYARKYALNGLFCIDDNRDPDATNNHGKENAEPKHGNKNAANRTPAGSNTRPSQQPAAQQNQRTNPPATQAKGDPASANAAPQQGSKPTPAKTPKEKCIEFVTELGVTQADLEKQMNKAFDQFTADDIALVREWCKIMINQKLSFSEAVAEVGK